MAQIISAQWLSFYIWGGGGGRGEPSIAAEVNASKSMQNHEP